MPTYEYQCLKCAHRFEVFQQMSDEPRKRCPECRGKVERLISGGSGLLFKGSGFYSTDYRSDSYHKSASADKPSGGGSDSGSSDKKPGASSDKGSSSSAKSDT